MVAVVSNTNHQADDLTCTFTLAVQRGVSPVKKRELVAANDVEKQFMGGRMTPIGCCYVQISDENYNAKYYYHSMSHIMYAASVVGLAKGLSEAVVAVGISFPLGLAAVPLALHGPGKLEVTEGREVQLYHDRLDMPISREKYDHMKTWLDKKAARYGVYGPFNNCAHFAVKAARKAGVTTLPRSYVGFNSPDLVSQRLRWLAANDDKPRPYTITTLENSFPRKPSKYPFS